jgi:hypothetical protein
VSRYKAILESIIESRPSGTKQRLAAALGTNRSFITQITSTAYATPIPAQHLDTIFAVCRFSPNQVEAFRRAYDSAKPPGHGSVKATAHHRIRNVLLPDLGDKHLNDAVDKLFDELARSLGAVIERVQGDPP